MSEAGRVLSAESYGTEACTRYEVRVGAVMFGTYHEPEAAWAQVERLWNEAQPVTVVRVTEQRLTAPASTLPPAS